MQLGGWQRLWFVVAALWAASVVLISWPSWPSPENAYHQFAFYDQIPAGIRQNILNSQVKAENESAFITDSESAKDAQRVQMPNGHILVFRRDLSKADMEAASAAYWNAVETELRARRMTRVWEGVAYWVVPLALLYLSGLAVKWIYRGFKPDT